MYGKYSPVYNNWTYYGWSILVEYLLPTAGDFGEFVKKVELKQEIVDGEAVEVCNVLLFGPKGTIQYKTRHAPLPGSNSPTDSDHFIVLKMGQHSPEPFFEGQQPSKASCKYLDGIPCYFNACSRLRIDINTSAFSEEGIAELWGWMVGLYVYFFEYDHAEEFWARYPYELFAAMEPEPE